MNFVVRRTAVAFAVAGLGTSAHAADMPVVVKAPPPPIAWNDILSVNNQWYLDFAALNIGYRETEGGTLDTENGWQVGAQTAVTVQRDWLGLSNLYFNGTFTWTSGTVTHGQPGAGNGTSTHSDIKDVDFRLGKGFGLGNSAQITPYFGIGTHFWDRQLGGAGGYQENYSDSYAGGGVLLQYSPLQRWVLSAYGLVGGTFGSSLSVRNYPAPVSSFDFALGNSAIYMAGASADYAITRQWHANVGVDWTHFQYGRSGELPTGAGTDLHEPDSRTSNVTVKGGFGYSFY